MSDSVWFGVRVGTMMEEQKIRFYGSYGWFCDKTGRLFLCLWIMGVVGRLFIFPTRGQASMMDAHRIDENLKGFFSFSYINREWLMLPGCQGPSVGRRICIYRRSDAADIICCIYTLCRVVGSPISWKCVSKWKCFYLCLLLALEFLLVESICAIGVCDPFSFSPWNIKSKEYRGEMESCFISRHIQWTFIKVERVHLFFLWSVERLLSQFI